MQTLRAAIALFILIGPPVSAETQKLVQKIHPSIPPIQLHVHKFLAGEDGWFQSIDWVEIRSGARKLQTIRFQENERPTFHREQTDPVTFRDVDCDGYKDILIQKEMGIHGDTWYYLFRFNALSGKFVEYKQFVELPFVSVDCSSKVVKTYVNSGSAGCTYEDNQYKWVAGKLQLIRQELQDDANDQQSFIRTIRTWQNGRQEVRQKKIVGEDCHQP
ncbi:MAG: hypothetical protein JWO13_3161 [Acidobacteriales bacterium]|nr:hypothetical protein [Terriglobales bacterium]